MKLKASTLWQFFLFLEVVACCRSIHRSRGSPEVAAAGQLATTLDGSPPASTRFVFYQQCSFKNNYQPDEDGTSLDINFFTRPLGNGPSWKNQLHIKTDMPSGFFHSFKWKSLFCPPHMLLQIVILIHLYMCGSEVGHKMWTTVQKSSIIWGCTVVKRAGFSILEWELWRSS